MTDTFTIEQIESAFKESLESGIAPITIEQFIAELTRPQWKPQVGEVVFNLFNEEYYDYVEHGSVAKTVRPLTPDEVPALKVAIEYIAGIRNDPTKDQEGIAKRTLAKIQEMTGK